MISSNGITTGSLTAANQAVTVNANTDELVGVQITGTFVGTVTFEATVDGTTWVATAMYAAATPTTIVTTATAAGLWRGTVAPFSQFRVRCSAYTSGTIVVSVIEAVTGR